MNHVLIVDDDTESAAALQALIAQEPFSVAVAHSLLEARRQLALRRPCLVLLDPHLPDGNGMALLSNASLGPQCQVAIVTGDAELESSISALRQGALDYLVKPISPGDIERVLARVTRGAVEPVADLDDHAASFGGLWGCSTPMQTLYEQIDRVAGTSVTVLITGESGTGKELVAQTLHDLSHRRHQPFLAVNCGAISPHLVESELFGHEKGSFTGADRQHRGFFERAAGGTLFLDEITEMPQALQVKLLRTLETGQFMRVGSTDSQSSDVRIVAATNRPPLDAMAEGKLREDLLYRLNVFPIALPPLRQRLADIPVLAQHFLDDISEREGRHKQLSAAALQQLRTYHWPGNVRELRNVIQRAYVMAASDTIDSVWLPDALHQSGMSPDIAPPSVPAAPAEPFDLSCDDLLAGNSGKTLRLPIGLSMAEAERRLIEATFAQCRFQKERTAAVLGISLKTLYNRLKEYAGS